MFWDTQTSWWLIFFIPAPPDGGNNIVVYSSRRLESKRNFTGSTGRFCIFYSHSGSCDPALFFIAGLWLDSQRKIGWEYTSIYMTIEKDFLSPSPTLYIVRGWRGFSPLPKARLLCDGYTQENERNRWDLVYYLSKKEKKYRQKK